MAEDISPREIIASFEQRFIDALQDSLVKYDKATPGSLWQSVKATTKIYGQKITLEISMEDYWKWVDEGRKAGSKQPPIEPILKFIRNRGITPKLIAKNKGLKKSKRKVINKEAQYRSLAFIIARGIKKHGIKPTHFATEVMEGNLLKEFKADITKAVGRNIKIEIDKEIKE